jgi:ribonuclease HI
MEDKIQLFADGACRNNGKADNIGAWAYVLLYNKHVKKEAQLLKNTTNNICELAAVIAGLAKIKDKTIPVEVISDSQYVVSGVNEWSKKWIENGWKNAKKKPVENMEMWRWLLDLVAKFYDITFTKCDGHAGNKYNEYVDELCNMMMDKSLIKE